MVTAGRPPDRPPWPARSSQPGFASGACV